MAALRYERTVLIYVEEDLRGERVALLLRKPSPEGGGFWHGPNGEGVDGAKLLGVNRIRVPSGEDDKFASVGSIQHDEDAITQEVRITGVGAPPF
jgi:hypothetical protein